jgi:WD40 repeat protein
MNLHNAKADESGEAGELLFVGFNQDSGCFACGLKNGFAIYNVDPFKETFRRIFPNGGIGIVEMLFRCNLLAIVGGGRNPRYPTNKVMIWDDHQNKCIGELKFRTEVKAVRLRRDRVVVVLETKVFVYRFKDLKLVDQCATVANPKGLVSICAEVNNNVLAIPGLSKGSIRLELYDIGKTTLMKAHDTDLAFFALNSDGNRLASASEKGTLIRIWNCHTGEPVRELRRGMDRAEIYCICFNQNSSFVACSSDKGTVHIYSLASNPQQGTTSTSGSNQQVDGSSKNLKDKPYTNNPSKETSNSSIPNASSSSHGGDDASIVSESSSTSTNKQLGGMGVNFLKGILPTRMVPKYFDSEWSFAQVRGIDGRSICAFSRESNKIIVLCADGRRCS